MNIDIEMTVTFPLPADTTSREAMTRLHDHAVALATERLLPAVPEYLGAPQCVRYYSSLWTMWLGQSPRESWKGVWRTARVEMRRANLQALPLVLTCWL